MTRTVSWDGTVLDRLSPTRRREAEDFARLLDDGRRRGDSPLRPLVEVARRLEPIGAPGPSADFRLALRERLMAEAAQRPVTLPHPRRPAAGPPARPSVGARVRQAVATVAIASMVTGLGAAAASTRALPGDPLYGLKRQVEAAQLAMAFSDLARGRELLEQADARLGEAERLVAAGSAAQARADIAMVLDDRAAAAAAGAEVLTRAYRETGDAEPMIVLDRFVTDQEERLEDLLVLLEPGLRARVRAALESLALLGARSAAVLTVAAGDRQPARGGEAVAATGDGWAVSRLQSHAPTGSGSDLDAGDGLLDTVVEDVTGEPAGSGSSAGSGSGSTGVLDPGTSGGSTATDLEDPLAVTEPVVSDPLVTTDPLVTADPLAEPAPPSPTSPLPSVSATPLPTLSVDTCVPLPPLTSC